MREFLAAGIGWLGLGRTAISRNQRRFAIRRVSDNQLVALRKSEAETDGDDDGARNSHGPAAPPAFFDLVFTLLVRVARFQSTSVRVLVTGLATAMIDLLHSGIAGHGDLLCCLLPPFLLRLQGIVVR